MESIRQKTTLIGFVLFSLPALTFPVNAGAADQVRIAKVSPAATKPLQAGSAVSFEIAFEYRIEDADHRRVRVEILRGGGGERTEVLSRWSQVLPKSRGTLTVQRLVKVPETANLTVRSVMEDAAPGLPGRLISSDKKEFEVVDRGGKRIKSRTGTDNITITSVVPASGSLLRTGDNVDFEVNLDYELRSSISGRIVWYLASAGRTTRTLSTLAIKEGKGSLSLKKTIPIGPGMDPDTGMYVFLMGEDYIRSLAADARQYRLEQLRENGISPDQITVNVESEYVDRVGIVSTFPAADQKLQTGIAIEFNVTVDYELATTDLAELSIRLRGGSIILAQDDRVVPKGRGTVTFTRRLFLPRGTERNFEVLAGLSPPSTAYETLRYSAGR